jgi:hypothetical protein
MDVPTDIATKLAVLVEGCLAVGAREGQPVTDAEGSPATLTECGRVALLRVIDETRKGHDRIDCFLIDDGDDDDLEVRLTPSDRVFVLQERGAEPPELEILNRDVRGWLGPVLLSLAQKITHDEAAGHA